MGGAGLLRWAALLGILVACVRAADATGSDRELIVSAAASLTNAVQEVGEAFEDANPGTKVILNFAASGALLQQIDQGAPVDVFASADEETMNRAEEKGLIEPGTRAPFTRNSLVLVAPVDSERSLSGVEDLGGDAVKRIALGDPSFVPAGRYARQALQSLSLWEAVQPKLIFANSVRQVLDYVARGEVDAGLVYRTDAALRRDRVQVVQTLEGHEPILYPVAIVKTSEHKDTARNFQDFLRGPGQAILSRFGFQSP